MRSRSIPRRSAAQVFWAVAQELKRIDQRPTLEKKLGQLGDPGLVKAIRNRAADAHLHLEGPTAGDAFTSVRVLLPNQTELSPEASERWLQTSTVARDPYLFGSSTGPEATFSEPTPPELEQQVTQAFETHATLLEHQEARRLLARVSWENHSSAGDGPWLLINSYRLLTKHHWVRNPLTPATRQELYELFKTLGSARQQLKDTVQGGRRDEAPYRALFPWMECAAVDLHRSVQGVVGQIMHEMSLHRPRAHPFQNLERYLVAMEALVDLHAQLAPFVWEAPDPDDWNGLVHQLNRTLEALSEMLPNRIKESDLLLELQEHLCAMFLEPPRIQ